MKEVFLLTVFVLSISLSTYAQDSPLIGKVWKLDIPEEDGHTSWATYVFNDVGLFTANFYLDGVNLAEEKVLYYFTNSQDDYFDHDKIGKLSNGKYIITESTLLLEIIFPTENTFKMRGARKKGLRWITLYKN